LGLDEGLEPLEKVAVVEGRPVRTAVAATLAAARCHQEVVPGMALLGITKHRPEMRDHRVVARGEPLAEQAAGPADVVEIDHLHGCLR
jgi:hypothetical protein